MGNLLNHGLVAGFAAVVSFAMTVAPSVAAKGRPRLFSSLGLAVLAAVVALAADGRIAFGVAASAAALHALLVFSRSRAGAAFLGLSSLCLFGAAAALSAGALDAAFVCSILAIAIRAGVVPLHAGVADLCERAPDEQVRQLASLLPLTLAHLAHLSSSPLGVEVSDVVFAGGAVAALLPGIAALAQKELRGLYRMTTMLHGGYLLCAVAAASHGHAAALYAASTLLLGVGGFGLVVAAVEARSGPVDLTRYGGRVAAFPHLAAAFAILGASGVGLPASAGFVADDLLLHAAWIEGLGPTAALVLASVALAVATLRGYARTFLGPYVQSVAPDLQGPERLVVVGVIATLLFLGVVPHVLVSAGH